MDWGTLLKIISDQGCPQDSFHICCSINTKEDQIRDQGSGISPGLFPEFLIPDLVFFHTRRSENQGRVLGKSLIPDP